MRNFKLKAACLCGMFASMTLCASRADASFLFDFNSLDATSTTIYSTNNSDPIETYMEGIYGSNITVVQGAKTQKNRIESLPTGLYLGNSDYATDRGSFVIPPGHVNPKDTFLINRWNATSLPSTERDRISITFDVPIISVSFDWEIFPVTISGANADFTFKADGTQYFYYQLLGSEKTLGDLGHLSFTFNQPVYRLEFIDWTDAPIGIDNLRVTQVPAPGSLILLGTGVGGFSLVRWRRKKRAAGS